VRRAGLVAASGSRDGDGMPASRPLPTELAGRVFTRAEALAHGLTPRMLDGSRIVSIHPGVHRYADTEPTFALMVEAARHVLPRDAAISHVTNLRWRGYEVGTELPLHFSTNVPRHVDREGLVVHRRQGWLHPEIVRGVPVLGPDRTFVDCATRLSVGTLVRVGDWLVATGQTDVTRLHDYVLTSHLDGVQRARRAALLVRAGSESPRETDVRLALLDAGLPEPELNVDIHDHRGRFVARGDLVYRTFGVLVEYDGWHHERDAAQRQHDHLRRERLEAEGWRVVVVTIADMRDPYAVAGRVQQALIQRGYSTYPARSGA